MAINRLHRNHNKNNQQQLVLQDAFHRCSLSVVVVVSLEGGGPTTPERIAVVYFQEARKWVWHAFDEFAVIKWQAFEGTSPFSPLLRWTMAYIKNFTPFQIREHSNHLQPRAYIIHVTVRWVRVPFEHKKASMIDRWMLAFAFRSLLYHHRRR